MLFWYGIFPSSFFVFLPFSSTLLSCLDTTRLLGISWYSLVFRGFLLALLALLAP